jgi:hypothetical protein
MKRVGSCLPLALVLLVTQALAQDELDNAKRFVGQWRVERDGWAHCMQIDLNQITNCSLVNPPLLVSYYEQAQCSGEPAWQNFGWVECSTQASPLMPQYILFGEIHKQIEANERLQASGRARAAGDEASCVGLLPCGLGAAFGKALGQMSQGTGPGRMQNAGGKTSGGQMPFPDRLYANPHAVVFRGYLFSRGEPATLSGLVWDEWGEWGWYAERTELKFQFFDRPRILSKWPPVIPPPK